VRQRAGRRARLTSAVKRASLPGVDLSLYARAIPVLLRNPSIIVIPLLMAVIGVLVGLTTSPQGDVIGGITSGLTGLIVLLLQLFGLGAACIIADDAWRHGRASFDRGWVEARRRGGDIFFAAIGITLLLAVASYVGQLIPVLLLVLLLSVGIVFFCIWAIPAAAVGGIPGGASIQVSIDRVRENPLSAALAAITLVGLVYFAAPYLSLQLIVLLATTGVLASGISTIVVSLIGALIKAIAIGYIALIITKTYTDAAFSPRRW
jgi:hypothetical protein